MIRGYYTAASGLITQEKRLNAIANNLANVSTVGYKKDDLVFGTFGEHLAVRMNTYNRSQLNDLGRGVFMQVTDSKYTNYMQGGFEETGRTVDMAIQGDGFFVLRNADGDERLTRDGQFGVDENGYLILPGFGRVQGVGGDLQVGSANIYVAENGTIYLIDEDADEDEEPEEIGRLLIAIPADYDALEKDAYGLYISEEYTYGPENPDNYLIMQGILERSNVDMTEEMTRMMSTQRSLQSASQLVRMYDEMTDKANSQISRV